ncbi:MAG: cytochrome C, partial [Polaromonas sp. 24-62-144]
AVNPSDRTHIFRAKLSYVYQARYGGSLSFFNRTGTTNTLNQTAGFDATGQITSASSTRVTGNLSGSPATRGLTYEAFWIPQQNVRIGAQYTAYNKFNGASNNYDGFGRNARDNNTLFLYAWLAY